MSQVAKSQKGKKEMNIQQALKACSLKFLTLLARGSWLVAKKGYSLIELMVVMSVLTLLIAMGIPTYNGVISKNRVKLSKGVGGTFQSALEMYKATNDGYPATSAMDTMDKLYTVLSPYLADDPRNSLHADTPFLSYVSSGSPNPTTYTLSVRSRTSEFIPVTATPKSLSAIYAGEEVPYP